MIILNNNRSVHFIGIGGVGMSGLGELLLSLGFSVTGSDRQASSITGRLEMLGARIQYNHTPDLVKQADIVVYSSAIHDDNAEWRFAKTEKIPLMRRAEMLGEFMRMKFSIGVAGTHGKTTTTSLIGKIVHDARRNPTVIVGGILTHYGSNAIMGSGEILVAEADEFDRSFLRMFPSIAVVTNIEADHLDCYADLDDIKNAFAQFMNSVPFYGAVIACADEPGVCEVVKRCSKSVITYGTAAGADYSACDIVFARGTTSFSLYKKNIPICDVTMPLPGLHNVKNACAALAVACELGIGVVEAATSLSEFSGVRRRFEVLGVGRGVTVIDDYAHHPTEIGATLSAARSAGYKKIIAVFQPHLYTRTRDFMNEFAQSLCTADEIVVTSIYKSREEPLSGVSAATIVEKIRGLGHTC
ncbi:MAG TPA: UDP-N-acetylmuramate--L-alanine ligase, partial [Chitinivibrionales bacterium]